MGAGGKVLDHIGMLLNALVSAARSRRFAGNGDIFWSAAMMKGPSSPWSGPPGVATTLPARFVC